MATLDALEDFVRDRIETDHWTHCQLCDYLQNAYPGERGSVCDLCKDFAEKKNIHKTARINTDDLHQAVADAIEKVGMYY